MQPDQCHTEGDWQEDEGTQDCDAEGAAVELTGRQARENADDLLKEKEELQKQQKAQDELAEEKLVALNKKLKTIGNYVHESVPVSDNEVRVLHTVQSLDANQPSRTTTSRSGNGAAPARTPRSWTASRTTKCSRVSTDMTRCAGPRSSDIAATV